MTTADNDIQELSDQLGLVNFAQDWGICNADAERVGEFIRLCRTGNLTLPQQFAMGELVLASMNEALADGAGDAELLGNFRAFLGMGLHGLASQIRYWASLTDCDEFPLAALLASESIPDASSACS